jgi:cellulose synthase/poly-beta-1,6-N-acetylglucosamine synthase-like glycosyltransferase
MLPIRQVDLAAALTPVPLPTGTSRCLLIFRWRDRVVGRRVVDVAGDAIAVDRLTALARETAPETALDAWCDDYLGHDRRALLGTTAPTVTVAICTRERPEDLDRALSAVAALSPRPLEVLVIDNAPTTDRTHALVAGYPGTRYIREDRRGLDAARNRALREARGDIVAFSDDDAAPEPRWLAGLVPNFADPRVVVVTGITLPLELETEGQELF